MFETLRNILAGHNEFASGGLLLMIIGGISVYLRSIPLMLWDCLVEQTTMIITVKDDDAAFHWVKEWFLEQDFLKRVRRLDLDTTVRNERIAMIPAPGKHWFWYSGRPFEVWFSRTDNTRERTGRRTESLTFRTMGRDRDCLERLVNDIVQSHLRREGVYSYLYRYNDGWSYVEGYAPRMLESVVLEPGEKEHLLEDIKRFRNSRKRYENIGVPYHRGYLLYGPPGTGKTSLVSALAGHFGLSIYTVNLTEFNDRSLMAAVSDVPRNSILLFEDIDCMKGAESRVEKKEEDGNGSAKQQTPSPTGGVTLSGLLNVLDGFYAPTGVLFVMTTNHAEKLDEALLRPGRIDYKLFLGQASRYQKMELYRRFFPEASEAEARDFVDSAEDVRTMAEFQGLLLQLDQQDRELRGSLLERSA
jgi:chaperone BCS1